MSKAVVAGASGIVGRHAIRYLQQQGWQVIGLSRHAAANLPDYQHMAVDLANREDCNDKLSSLRDISHVFFAVRSDHPDPAQESAINLQLLRNTVESLDLASPTLEHISLMHGNKWYGSHLGPFKTPAKEDDERLVDTPIFYYAQQDYIVEQQQLNNYQWTWSSLRPHFVCGVSVGYPHNFMAALAIYGTVCKELGLPLRFPGHPGCYTSVSQVTDAELLAKAMYWAATTPACANQAFNILNGDYFRWQYTWPKIADFFNLTTGPVEPFKLADFMADKTQLWQDIVQKHQLKPYPLATLVDWQYTDYVIAARWDELCSITKSRQFGFHETLDSDSMFINLLSEYRRQRIIP